MQMYHEKCVRKILGLGDDLPIPKNTQAIVSRAENLLAQRATQEFTFTELAILIVASDGDLAAKDMKAEQAKKQAEVERKLENERLAEEMRREEKSKAEERREAQAATAR